MDGPHENLRRQWRDIDRVLAVYCEVRDRPDVEHFPVSVLLAMPPRELALLGMGARRN